jgi:hypothetical protein
MCPLEHVNPLGKIHQGERFLTLTLARTLGMCSEAEERQRADLPSLDCSQYS